MFILAIIGLVAMGFILGLSCRKSHDFYDIDVNSFEREKANKYKIENDKLYYENIELKKEMQRDYGRYGLMYFQKPCYKCIAKTPDEQKTADLLKGITKNVDEIAEKLDIKIV